MAVETSPYRETAAPPRVEVVELALMWADHVLEVAHVEVEGLTSAELVRAGWSADAASVAIEAGRAVVDVPIWRPAGQGAFVVARPSTRGEAQPRRWLDRGGSPCLALVAIFQLTFFASLQLQPPATASVRSLEALGSERALALHLVAPSLFDPDDEPAWLSHWDEVAVLEDPDCWCLGHHGCWNHSGTRCREPERENVSEPLLTGLHRLSVPHTRVVLCDEEPFGARCSESVAGADETGLAERGRRGDVVVRGGLSREIVRRTVRRHLNEVRFCYEQELANHPDLAGRVTVAFLISPTGSVSSANVANTTLRNARVEACITTAVRRWTFPAPDGGIVAVDYPFVLEPRE